MERVFCSTETIVELVGEFASPTSRMLVGEAMKHFSF